MSQIPPRNPNQQASQPFFQSSWALVPSSVSEESRIFSAPSPVRPKGKEKQSADEKKRRHKKSDKVVVIKKKTIDLTSEDDDRGQQESKSKYRWSAEELKVLIDELTEADRDSTAEGGFKKPVWTKVVKVINKWRAKQNLPSRDARAVKSAWQRLTKEYLILRDLRYNKNSSGWGWDSSRHCLDVAEDVWDRYEAAHPSMRKYRKKKFPFFDQIGNIVDKSKATGEYVFQPAPPPAADNIYDSNNSSPWHSGSEDGIEHEENRDTENSSSRAELKKDEDVVPGHLSSDNGSSDSSSEDDRSPPKKKRTAAAPPARRSRAKISGPEAISALGYSVDEGLTRLGEEFSKADTFRFRARAQLSNEIQRSHELTDDEKLNLLTAVTYDDHLFEALATLPKGSDLKIKMMKRAASVAEYVTTRPC